MKTSRIADKLIDFVYRDNILLISPYIFRDTIQQFLDISNEETFKRLWRILIFWQNCGYILFPEDKNVLFLLNIDRLPSKEVIKTETRLFIQSEPWKVLTL